MGEGEASQDYNQSTPFHPLPHVCLHRPHRPLTATIAVNCLIDCSFTSLLPLLSSRSISIIGVIPLLRSLTHFQTSLLLFPLRHSSILEIDFFVHILPPPFPLLFSLTRSLLLFLIRQLPLDHSLLLSRPFLHHHLFFYSIKLSLMLALSLFLSLSFTVSNILSFSTKKTVNLTRNSLLLFIIIISYT